MAEHVGRHLAEHGHGMFLVENLLRQLHTEAQLFQNWRVLYQHEGIRPDADFRHGWGMPVVNIRACHDGIYPWIHDGIYASIYGYRTNNRRCILILIERHRSITDGRLCKWLESCIRRRNLDGVQLRRSRLSAGRPRSHRNAIPEISSRRRLYCVSSKASIEDSFLPV
ncbi:hypothetical protein D3C85_867790 [compost metagenome]